MSKTEGQQIKNDRVRRGREKEEENREERKGREGSTRGR